MVDSDRVRGAFDRILKPLRTALTPELAKALLKLRLDKKTQGVLDDFAERHHEGQLTPKELSDYDALVSAINLVSALQAQARSYLRSRKAS